MTPGDDPSVPLWSVSMTHHLVFFHPIIRLCLFMCAALCSRQASGVYRNGRQVGYAWGWFVDPDVCAFRPTVCALCASYRVCMKSAIRAARELVGVCVGIGAAWAQ